MIAQPKIKKFRKTFHFSRIFPIILQIIINFNANFLKNSPNLSSLDTSLISFQPEKIGPRKHLADAPQPKNPG